MNVKILNERAKKYKEAKRIGADMAAKRKAARHKQSYVAAAIGISSAFLCSLEKGQKVWSDEIKARFLKAIEE